VPTITEIIEQFQWADDEMRLQMLLDYSRKLPPIPDRYVAERDAGIGRVPECVTPVFFWTEIEDGALVMHIDVAEEAPTVKGILSIIRSGYEGAGPEAVAELPNDLVNRLGLQNQIRMNRLIGLAGIMGRIRRAAAELAGASATDA
jgi:cysteine desulfuration protein SufE